MKKHQGVGETRRTHWLLTPHVTPAGSEAPKRERTCKTFWTAVTSVWLTSHRFNISRESQNWQGDCHLNHPDSKRTIGGYNHNKEYCFRVLWETVYFSYLTWVTVRSLVIQQYTIYLSLIWLIKLRLLQKQNYQCLHCNSVPDILNHHRDPFSPLSCCEAAVNEAQHFQKVFHNKGFSRKGGIMSPSSDK